MESIIWIIIGYVAGSIPTGYVVTKLVKKIDIRKHGSGNCGATNVFRVTGAWWGGFTMLVDALKGTIPTLLAVKYFGEGSTISIIVGVACIVGHVYTCMLSFKGGKGVATAAGVFGALMPIPTAAAFTAFVIVFAISKYVSLGSIIASIVLPVTAIIFKAQTNLITFAVVIAVLIIYKHSSNIKRLLNGTELKIGVKK